MKSRWRNIAALLLTLVFAPSSVLAAMPVVWCIGSDGHRAVEFVNPGKHDHRPLHGHLTHQDEVDAAIAGYGDCLDRQLLDNSKTSIASNDGIVPFDFRAVVVLPSCPLRASDTGGKRRFFEPARPPPDAVRVARRSVVLLI